MLDLINMYTIIIIRSFSKVSVTGVGTGLGLHLYASFILKLQAQVGLQGTHSRL